MGKWIYDEKEDISNDNEHFAPPQSRQRSSLLRSSVATNIMSHDDVNKIHGNDDNRRW